MEYRVRLCDTHLQISRGRKIVFEHHVCSGARNIYRALEGGWRSLESVYNHCPHFKDLLWLVLLIEDRLENRMLFGVPVAFDFLTDQDFFSGKGDIDAAFAANIREAYPFEVVAMMLDEISRQTTRPAGR